MLAARAVRAGVEVGVDSAGTGSWHLGDPPDPRAVEAAARRGYAMDHLRARKVTAEDFPAFDHVFAMDRSNLRDLLDLHPGAGATPRLYLTEAPHLTENDVPDPYGGGEDGFEHVLDLLEAATDAFLERLSARP